MSNENLSALRDRIWNQYQFTFQDTTAIDEQLSASIREKIAALNLQKDSLDIRYEKVGEDPLVLNIFIEEEADAYQATSLLKTQEKKIFPLSDKPTKMRAFTPVEAGADAQLSASAETDFDGTAPAGTDSTQVAAITFRGAVRNPPPASDTLP
ncbi:MAG: hypothetical protein INR73_19355 [Williamsia sp.]|nr:hypothetical protein [Williamsia sp.]